MRKTFIVFLIFFLCFSSISGFQSPIAKANPTYEDFTTYTEVDPNSHIGLVGTDHIDFVAYGNEDAYLYKDKGSGHFTDFEHLIDAKLSTAYGSYVPAFFWALTNNINDMKGISDANQHAIGALMSDESPQYWLRIWETYLGTRYWSTPYVISSGTWYYLEIIKSGTNFQCKIYSDPARTSLITTLSLTMHADPSFQYVFASNTYNKGTAYTVTLDIENLDLQEEGEIYTEYHSLSINVTLSHQRIGTFTRYSDITPTIVLGFQKVGEYLRHSDIHIVISLASTTYKYIEMFTFYSALTIRVLKSNYVITPEVAITGMGIAILAFIIAIFALLIALASKG